MLLAIIEKNRNEIVISGAMNLRKTQIKIVKGWMHLHGCIHRGYCFYIFFLTWVEMYLREISAGKGVSVYVGCVAS